MNVEDLINKITCADCMDILKQLPDKCIDLVLTDPPYGMNYQSGRREQKYEKIKDDNNLDWLPAFLNEIKRFQKMMLFGMFFVVGTMLISSNKKLKK